MCYILNEFLHLLILTYVIFMLLYKLSFKQLILLGICLKTSKTVILSYPVAVYNSTYKKPRHNQWNNNIHNIFTIDTWKICITILCITCLNHCRSSWIVSIHTYIHMHHSVYHIDCWVFIIQIEGSNKSPLPDTIIYG